MTSLEALEEIKHTTDLYLPNELNGYEQELDIIEKDLKILGILKKYYKSDGLYNEHSGWIGGFDLKPDSLDTKEERREKKLIKAWLEENECTE